MNFVNENNGHPSETFSFTKSSIQLEQKKIDGCYHRFVINAEKY